MFQNSVEPLEITIFRENNLIVACVFAIRIIKVYIIILEIEHFVLVRDVNMGRIKIFVCGVVIGSLE